MFTRRRSNRRAFTLLEVMVATMIVAMLALTLYRFIGANLTAIRVSTEISEERETLQAVVRYLQMQLNDLPPKGQAALTGRANKFHDLSNDEMSWTCTAGPGLMTSAAATGLYRVTLTVQPVDERSSETELGLRRRPAEADAPVDGALFGRGGRGNQYNWLPLIRPMAALEIRYFDPRINAWLDAWNDQNARPQLVRLRMWKNPDDRPIEAILQVPSARVTQ